MSHGDRAVRRALAWVALALVWAAPGMPQTPPEFDHVGTRFPLTGSHRRASCNACHTGGLFAGTPTRCAFCHDGSDLRAETSKPLDHVPSSDQCDDCHDTVLWDQVVFDHRSVMTACMGCHNGTNAGGKSPDHVVTSSDCDACHFTLAWSPASFDHADVTQPCESCHNGMTATGKDPGHLLTTAGCEICHSTRAWSPTTFSHEGIVSPCSSCHDGSTATGTPADHFVTSLECDACHSTTRWTGARYVHNSATYPGNHRRNLGCRDCHRSNTEMVDYSSPAYQPDCAGCHASDFKPGPHKKFENPDTFYTVGELRDCTGACHVYTDATLSTIKKRRTGEHRVSDSEF